MHGRCRQHHCRRRRRRRAASLPPKSRSTNKHLHTKGVLLAQGRRMHHRLATLVITTSVCVRALTRHHHRALVGGGGLASTSTRRGLSFGMSTCTTQVLAASQPAAASIVLSAAQPHTAAPQDGDAEEQGSGVFLESAGAPAKRAAMRELLGGSAAGLMVVADFDLTLTAPGSQQCHHMFGRSRLLSDTSRGHMETYLVGRVPEGHEPLLTHGEWWDRVHALLARHPMTRSDIREMVRENVDSGLLRLRPGAADLMRLLHDWDIPLLIVSAGVTDVIEETLANQGVLFPNVRIHSNSMVFCDQSGSLKAFGETVVHSRNKHESHRREQEWFARMSQAGRRCALILGDKPHDASVLDGSPVAAALTFGFYDADECSRNALSLEDYTRSFDVTCTGETMDLVAALVRELVGGDAPAADATEQQAAA